MQSPHQICNLSKLFLPHNQRKIAARILLLKEVTFYVGKEREHNNGEKQQSKSQLILNASTSVTRKNRQMSIKVP